MRIPTPILPNSATLEHLAQKASIKAGDIIKALPTLEQDNGLFRVTIGELNIDVKLDAPVAVGQLQDFEVVTADGVPQLRAITPEIAAARQLAAPVPPPAPIPDVDVHINISASEQHRPPQTWSTEKSIQAIVLQSSPTGAITLKIGDQVVNSNWPTLLPEGTQLQLRLREPAAATTLQEPATQSNIDKIANRQNIDSTTEAPIAILPTLKKFFSTYINPSPEATSAAAKTSETDPIDTQLSNAKPAEFIVVGVRPPVPATVVSELKRLLPIQDSVVPLLKSIDGLHANAVVAELPPTVQRLVEKLSSAIKQLDTLGRDPLAVRDALKNSGLFTEAQLARSSEPSAVIYSDIKSLLFLLKDALHSVGANTLDRPPQTQIHTPPSPPLAEFATEIPIETMLLPLTETTTTKAVVGQLLHQTEAAIARLETAQYGIITQSQIPPVWMMDLAYRAAGGPNLANIRVDQDEAAATPHKEKQPHWQITITLAPAALGQIEIKIRLAGNRINVLIHAHKTTTAKRINSNLPRLNAQLLALGFNVEYLSCTAQQPLATKTVKHRGWIDEST